MSIYGEIRSGSQNIELRRKARLFDVISFAGGTNEEAGDEVQVFRTQPLMCSENTKTANLRRRKRATFLQKCIV
jgi:hypothetical protein